MVPASAHRVPVLWYVPEKAPPLWDVINHVALHEAEPGAGPEGKYLVETAAHVPPHPPVIVGKVGGGGVGCTVGAVGPPPHATANSTNTNAKRLGMGCFAQIRD
jgi:hypothetical protein